MAAVTVHSDLEPAKIKCVSVSTFSPSICHKVMGPDTVIFVFWMFSFKPSFSLSSFALIRRLFSFSSLSAIRVVSSAYLRLLMFLLAVLIPACVDPAWHYTWCTLHISQVSRVTVYNLDILFSQFWTSPFPMSGSNCCFMTCIQVSQQVGKVVWYSHLLKNLPVYCDLHKGFSIVSEADVFLKFSCFLMIQWMLAVRTLIPLPYLNPACTSGSSWFTCFWSLAWRILSISLLTCEMSAIDQ